jgi:uncharacterized protein YqhQ
MPPSRLHALELSALGMLLSGIAVVSAFAKRKVRRGLGMAITALVLFLLSTWFLSGLNEVRRLAEAHPAAHHRLVSFPSPPRLEFRR